MVEKRPGRDGPDEILALCSNPSKLGSVFQAHPEAYPDQLYSNSAAYQQDLEVPAGGPPSEVLEKSFCNRRNSCRHTIALARR
jgi:hypothetical protein